MKLTFKAILNEIKRKRLSKTTFDDHPLSTAPSSSWNKKFLSQEINVQLQKDISRANYNLIYPSITNINDLTTDIILVYFYNNGHIAYSQGIPDIIAFFIHLSYTEDTELLYKQCESLLNSITFALDEEDSENDIKLDKDLLAIHNAIINSDYIDVKYRPDISPSVYAKKWFKTLFVRHFNKELVEFIWKTYLLDTNNNIQKDIYTNCMLCFCIILLSIRRKISEKIDEHEIYNIEDALLTFMTPTLNLKKFKDLIKEATVLLKECLNN
eukprot:GAHX01000412.1.p1 GENE.GAHX01000412.1~~GAHX01000412.1.p1  ORF type:complete len:269 (+),score=56.79 GAHX01000412.1:40-846(+)